LERSPHFFATQHLRGEQRGCLITFDHFEHECSWRDMQDCERTRAVIRRMGTNADSLVPRFARFLRHPDRTVGQPLWPEPNNANRIQRSSEHRQKPPSRTDESRYQSSEQRSAHSADEHHGFGQRVKRKGIWAGYICQGNHAQKKASDAKPTS